MRRRTGTAAGGRAGSTAAIPEPGHSSDAVAGLAAFGLQAGDTVRWRSGGTGHWRTGRVKGVERDGSIAVTDGKGASRSLGVDHLEAETLGRRGAPQWEPLTVRASRPEQLHLLEPP